jgi:hypothetical protein
MEIRGKIDRQQRKKRTGSEVLLISGQSKY